MRLPRACAAEDPERIGERPRLGLGLGSALAAIALSTALATAPPARGQAEPTAAPASAPAALLAPEERRWLATHDGAIRIGITVIPPQVLRVDGGYDGLSIDYIRLLERKLGCKFVLVPYGTWGEVVEAARNRAIDAIFAAQRTPERDAFLLFSRPYIELPNMILVRKDRSGGTDLRAMEGWTVAVSEGSAVHEYLRGDYPHLKLRPMRDELAGLMRLSLGEVDAMVVELSRASYYIEKAGILNLRVAGSAGLLYELRFAVRRDWPVLVGILDKGLAAVSDEERREISRRWIPLEGRGPFASKALRAWLAGGLAAVGLLLAAIFAWNRTLRRTVRQRSLRLTEELAEREKAESRLAEAQRIAHIGHWELDADSGRMSWSDETRRILGVEPRERGPDWGTMRELIHPEDRPACDRALAQALGNGAPYQLDHRLVTPSGALRHVHCQGVAIRDGPGPARRMFGTIQDVTERRQAEQELALMSFALDKIREAAFLIDEQARFRFVNEEACRALGYTRAELLAIGVPEVDPDFPAARWPAHWSELKAQRALLFEGRHRTKDGRVFPVEIAANYFEFSGEGFNLALVRDITERRRAEEERLRMDEQLRQAQKLEAVGKLAGGVAHDFNNLLTAILGACASLASSLDDGSALREDVQDIQGAAQKAAHLTRQLLAFGRKQAIRPEEVDLAEVVDSTLRMLRRLIGEDIELERASEPGLGRVVVDRGQIEQVILNLALNARDAMPAGGRITIATSNAVVGEDEARRRSLAGPGRYVLLTVADTGVGLSPEARAHLFEPFFTTKGVGQGTGLGLSMVYGIVKQCGGDIQVESEPGAGTVFRIYFPRAESEAAPTRPIGGPSSEGAPPTGAGTLLVVEDDSMVRNVVVKALRGAGYTVFDAASGEEALRLVAASALPEVDAVVTDVVMPHLGGLELSDRLRERRPGLRVLFISGYTDEAADLRGRLGERTAFLAKPFTAPDLARTVRELLERRGPRDAGPRPSS